MAKLIIEVKRDLQIVGDSIKEMVDKKEIGAVTGKIYGTRFKLTQAALYNVIKSRIKKYIKEETKNALLCIDENEDLKYIEDQYRTFENFLFSGEKEIENEPAYKSVQTDRVMRRILQKLKWRGQQAKDGAINKALGGRTVLGFFTSCGILITYKMEK